MVIFGGIVVATAAVVGAIIWYIRRRTIREYEQMRLLQKEGKLRDPKEMIHDWMTAEEVARRISDSEDKRK